MEHRLATRFNVGLDVDIWRGNNELGCFRSKDISHGGIFIRDCAHSVSTGDFVYLRVKTENNIDGDEYTLKAQVVHRTEEGAGFIWVCVNNGFHRELENLRAYDRLQ